MLAGLVLALLLLPCSSSAQFGAAAPAAAQQEPSKDPLGRDTPRRTVLGFINAARDGKYEVAPLYLDTNLSGAAAVDLARKLFVVLDQRLPARLNELSDQPDGARDNALKPDQNVVGIINTANGPFEVVVERVTRGKAAPAWLFSRATLASIPDAYEEVDRIPVERFVPGFLTRSRVFGIRLLTWVAFVFVLPLSYRLLGSVTWMARPLLALWHRRSGTVDSRPVRHIPGLVRLVILAVAIRWALGILEIPLLERQFWSIVATLLMVVATGWFLLLLNGYGERYMLRQFVGSGDISSILRLARRVADVLVVAACGVATLRYFGFDPTAALAGLGIGGIAVALAAQKTLENVIAGMSLIFDKAVRVGDTIRFGETVGTVDYIGLRSTCIRTLDRTMLTVPNGQIASVGIETLSVRDKYWFHHVLGLRFGTSAEQMRAVIDGIQRLLAAHANVDGGSVRVRLLRLGSSSLDVEIVAYVFAADGDRFLGVQQELLLAIMKIIDASGTAIASASQTVYVGIDRSADPAVTHR